MTVNPDGIIKGFDVFKNKPVGVPIILNVKAIKPFPFNQGMKGFDAGVIVRISGMRVASLQVFCSFAPGVGNILATTV